MANRIVEALASSSAHGISRAAATNSNLLRVAWIILFLCFLGLFCNSARTLVDKIVNVTIMTTNQADKVRFKFPDIYLCPTNPISGSYPYALNETEAALVNDEFERLGKIYDSLHISQKDSYSPSRADMILKSASPEVMKLLYQRPEQSLFFMTTCKSPHIESTKSTVIFPTNQCFKLDLSTELAIDLQKIAMEDPRIELCLFTDPYNTHFKYNGSHIKPIIDGNTSIPIEDWHQLCAHHEDVTATGFTMYLVREGNYPSMFETSVKLSPGWSYDITISMEEVLFSDELQNQNCTPSNINLWVVDPLTREKKMYFGTLYGNMFTEYSRKLHQKCHFVHNEYAVPWELRDAYRLYNLYDYSRYNVKNCTMTWRNIRSEARTRTVEYEHYLSLQPCHFHRYRIDRLSSHKWPAPSGNLWNSFVPSTDNESRPAIDQLIRAAQKIYSNSGNHSAHLESMIMQNFIANSMLKVSIRAQSQMSPRIEISYSYSWTSFMSEIGGLLGLYIGCSMLTVCELLELCFHVVCALLKFKRRDSRPQELTAVAHL